MPVKAFDAGIRLGPQLEIGISTGVGFRASGFLGVGFRVWGLGFRV